MSYKYTPRQEPPVLSQEEVDKALQIASGRSKGNHKTLTYAEKLEVQRMERELREWQRKFKQWEKYIKEWEKNYTPEMEIMNSISCIVSQFSRKELGHQIHIEDIYGAVRNADTFTLYSFVVMDFKLPSKFYFNDEGKQYKLELESKPLSHTVDLITRSGGRVELTFPLQKTVYKIKHTVEFTKEMRNGDPLKNALGILSLAKPEMIPPAILKNIQFLFDLSPASAMNPELMLVELGRLSRFRGEFYFREQMETQLDKIQPGIGCSFSMFKSKERTNFVLDQSEIYEKSLIAS